MVTSKEQTPATVDTVAGSHHLTLFQLSSADTIWKRRILDALSIRLVADSRARSIRTARFLVRRSKPTNDAGKFVTACQARRGLKLRSVSPRRLVTKPLEWDTESSMQQSSLVVRSVATPSCVSLSRQRPQEVEYLRNKKSISVCLLTSSQDSQSSSVLCIVFSNASPE